VDVIRVRAPSNADAQRLMAALAGGFAVTLDGGSPSTEVELKLDSETATELIGLFETLGQWLSDGGLATCEIGFGERNYTLLAATSQQPNDATAFLLERTIQLQTALDSRVVIEQAKGILAERNSMTPQEAFDGMRRVARSRRMKLHDLAATIIASTGASKADHSTATAGLAEE